jgi:hypothetical protein
MALTDETLLSLGVPGLLLVLPRRAAVYPPRMASAPRGSRSRWHRAGIWGSNSVVAVEISEGAGRRCRALGRSRTPRWDAREFRGSELDGICGSGPHLPTPAGRSGGQALSALAAPCAIGSKPRYRDQNHPRSAALGDQAARKDRPRSARHSLTSDGRRLEPCSCPRACIPARHERAHRQTSGRSRGTIARDRSRGAEPAPGSRAARRAEVFSAATTQLAPGVIQQAAEGKGAELTSSRALMLRLQDRVSGKRHCGYHAFR